MYEHEQTLAERYTYLLSKPIDKMSEDDWEEYGTLIKLIPVQQRLDLIDLLRARL